MLLSQLKNHEEIKRILRKEVLNNCIPHAQLFEETSNDSALPLALAFSTFVFCKSKSDNDSCGKCSSCRKMMTLNHPDIHFFFPSKNLGVKKSGSKEAFQDFRVEILKNPHIDEKSWYKLCGIKTQGEIRVSDARVINKIANLKSYEGGVKIFIIWCADKMNIEASNKLLKNIEEPNSNTIFIFISRFPDKIIPTVKSRLQATKISRSNNYSNEELGYDFEDFFIRWVRLCFLSLNKRNIKELLDWCDNISKCENYVRLDFLEKSVNIFRSCIFNNLNLKKFELSQIESKDFNFEKFSKLISHKNVTTISKIISAAHFAISNYANAKLIFFDLSLTIGRLLNNK